MSNVWTDLFSYTIHGTVIRFTLAIATSPLLQSGNTIVDRFATLVGDHSYSYSVHVQISNKTGGMDLRPYSFQ